MQHTTIDELPEVELLWFIHPDHWNRGYATEMAREAVRVASCFRPDAVASGDAHETPGRDELRS